MFFYFGVFLILVCGILIVLIDFPAKPVFPKKENGERFIHGGGLSGVPSIRQKIRQKKRVAIMEDEIYRSAALLSNITILQDQTPKGAVYIIEQLLSFSGDLRRPFEHMLYYLRQNRTEEALDAFEKEAGTKSAREYGTILLQMEKMNPADQKENITLLRKKLMEEKITGEKRKNETISDLIYIPVLANIIIIFVNFIYIGFYAEQKELFQQLLTL